jgi:UrcA family protein
MTTKYSISRSLLALAAAVVAFPLAADEPMTVTGQQLYQERVGIADLDLTKWAHRYALRARVHHASERVCIALQGPIGAYDYDFTGGPNAGLNCVDLTYRHARPQMAAAIDRARSGQTMAASLTVRLVARTR